MEYRPDRKKTNLLLCKIFIGKSIMSVCMRKLNAVQRNRSKLIVQVRIEVKYWPICEIRVSRIMREEWTLVRVQFIHCIPSVVLGHMDPMRNDFFPLIRFTILSVGPFWVYIAFWDSFKILFMLSCPFAHLTLPRCVNIHVR